MIANISIGAMLGKSLHSTEGDTICFYERDMKDVTNSHDDALAITAESYGFNVKVFWLN